MKYEKWELAFGQFSSLFFSRSRLYKWWRWDYVRLFSSALEKYFLALLYSVDFIKDVIYGKYGDFLLEKKKERRKEAKQEKQKTKKKINVDKKIRELSPLSRLSQ